MKYLNTEVDFYHPAFGSVPQRGYVEDFKGEVFIVKVLYGKFHGQYVEVGVDDIIDDSYDKYDCSDEKTYAWWDGE